MAKRTFIQIVIGLIVFVFGIGIGFAGCFIWLEQASQTSAVKLIAARLNISPDYKTIRTYIYCELLPPGASRMKVEENLLSVGPYNKNENSSYTNYIFEHPDIAYVIGELSLSFDKEDHLLTKAKRAGFGDYENLDEQCK